MLMHLMSLEFPIASLLTITFYVGLSKASKARLFSHENADRFTSNHLVGLAWKNSSAPSIHSQSMAKFRLWAAVLAAMIPCLAER
jgi:hypothetical protein